MIVIDVRFININVFGLFMFKVKVRVRVQCHPILEDKFGQVIGENYYLNNHFWFELDHRQTSKLMYLFVSTAMATKNPVPQYNTKTRIEYPYFPRETLKRGEVLCEVL